VSAYPPAARYAIASSTNGLEPFVIVPLIAFPFGLRFSASTHRAGVGQGTHTHVGTLPPVWVIDSVFFFCSYREMKVETLGDAFTHSWRVTARFRGGVVDDRTHTRRCVYQEELDLHTLVWTRGRNFPLARLESCLMCPRCGARRRRARLSTACRTAASEG
jgi:hypothetical protein